jgi:hypothetical protein
MARMRDVPLSFFDGLELKVTLRHIQPAIWRALRVPARLTLAQLHDVLQVAFGWTNSHLHVQPDGPGGRDFFGRRMKSTRT